MEQKLKYNDSWNEVQTPIFDVIKCDELEPNFRPVKIRATDWVSIAVEKDGKFLMERQFRPGLNSVIEEFPCGMVEPGENPIYAAARELREETGIDIAAGRLTYLGRFAANPAFMTNYMHYFYVNLDVSKYTVTETTLDAHEHIEVFWKDKTDVCDAVSGSASLSKDIPALLGCKMWLLKRLSVI